MAVLAVSALTDRDRRYREGALRNRFVRFDAESRFVLDGVSVSGNPACEYGGVA